MRKITLFVTAIFAVIFITGLASAGGYTYYYPRHTYSYSYPVYEMQNQEFPSYTNLPTIKDTSSNSASAASSYSRNYQGPIIERITKYDELTQIGRRGRSTKTVSLLTTEKYIGASESEVRGSEARTQSNKDYSLTPDNPTIFDGGSLWRYRETFNRDVYSRNSYRKPYYYAPTYDSTRGYYNWRY